ncbi:unnamed protein product [Schistosoma mattheei]|uniref:Uncharacterized protein n=1 Tax=Schistosoma mattheei TaxID=31246 RepID=A0A183PB85_9TREM|nr:unnamed protein product [Schistosoma mattheei]
MDECVNESLHESLTSSNLNETVAVIHDLPRSLETSISETCPVVGLNPIIPETQCSSSDLSSSQKDGVLLNTIEIVEVPAHKGTENKSSSIMSTAAPNGGHHSATKFLTNLVIGIL